MNGDQGIVYQRPIVLEYKTLAEPVQGLFTDRGSKFIAYIHPISARDQVHELLESLKSEHLKARHLCYAYRLGVSGEDYRHNDDGEPSGSAGLPIYNQLLSHDLTQLVAVVVRYFGGTKLGVPGLIHAYKSAVTSALEHALISLRYVQAHYRVQSDYAIAARVMDVLQSDRSNVVDAQYLHSYVTYDIHITADEHERHMAAMLADALKLPSPDMLNDVPVDQLSYEFVSYLL